MTPPGLRRDLRGSFASLLLAKGQSVLEIARQLDHSPATCLRDYAALFDDFDPAVHVDPEGEVLSTQLPVPVVREPSGWPQIPL